MRTLLGWLIVALVALALANAGAGAGGVSHHCPRFAHDCERP